MSPSAGRRARSKRVMSVFGTRPEAIKIAPLVRGLQTHRGFDAQVVVTGQHRLMLDQVLDVFRLRPDVDLDIFAHGQTLEEITARTLVGLRAVLGEFTPDLVLVQGDTTTAFAAALAAFYADIPVAHVEAGLRTGDVRSPFPEEMNRSLVARLAVLHLAPTAAAKANLCAEGIAADRVVVTGNSVIDALQWTVRRASPYSDRRLRRLDATDAPVLLVTAHRRESWGEGMACIAAALAALAQRRPELTVVVPMHPNPIVRSALIPAVAALPNVLLTEPLAYGEFARLLQRASIVLTDSGGIQEEAPSLGKPVLVIRDTTERVEAIAAGTARLVGTGTARIVAEVERLLDDDVAYAEMATAMNPYGDGRATERTLRAVERFFGSELPLEEFAGSELDVVRHDEVLVS